MPPQLSAEEKKKLRAEKLAAKKAEAERKAAEKAQREQEERERLEKERIEAEERERVRRSLEEKLRLKHAERCAAEDEAHGEAYEARAQRTQHELRQVGEP